MKPLIIFFCLVFSSLAEEGGVVVKTGFGLINGKIQSSEPNNRKYGSFLGIPYAKPPIGPLRFLPAEPINHFYGPHAPLQATEYKGDCAQLEIGSGKYKGSEDCLYLNVFTPDIHFTGENNLPVLVWIHGGGFLIGGSDPGFYGPDRWLDHDIVLVTFNYRLGALGFLSTGDGVAPPNNGLSDQQLVLAWVKENIQAFGGNPSQVTIFGESAGGTSVMAHMSSPRSRGLFNQGIAMSGTFGFMNPLIHSSRPIQHYTSIMAAELSCDITGSAQSTVSCLRNKTAEDIIRKANLFVRYNFLNNPFKPVVDADLPDPVLPHPLHDPCISIILQNAPKA
ncbi:putative inactive carboxylesterase 4 [Eurytemora carolleeae]|uniref:putative inactive carboxylesterase 4 n=1 Tax=Eurytemora carolleeae TaxID=1294199 RepID=UPI000C78C40D|nr:putative inactive carboxylesterase 4 [Eurytemora carolleeae]|eukprot:XP_023336019.1 putative inactive carboxylesterase 4 [Eurytemora affinis]